MSPPSDSGRLVDSGYSFLFKNRGSNDTDGGVRMTPAKESLRSKILAEPMFSKLFSRTPLSVTLDPNIKHADRTAFDVIAYLSWPGNRCYESLSELADVLSTDKHQVLRSLRRLETCGHIRRCSGAIELTSAIFSEGSGSV